MSRPIGPRRKSPPANRPDGFEPPYDAFEPRFREMNDLVMVIFGIERRSGNGEDLKGRLLTEFNHEAGPTILEHAEVKTGFGPSSLIWFAYWRSKDAYTEWQDSSAIETLFDDETILSSDYGLWREFCHISLDHNETSFSRATDLTGLSAYADALEVTPLHAYWGSMRDRIVAAADSALDAELLSLNGNEHGLGKRIRFAAPANTCLIKTTQDWSQTTPEQTDMYMSDVRPAYEDGVSFTRQNGAEVGCIGARMVREHSMDGEPMDRTVTIGFWTSIGHLEEWTHSHPTHERIMGEFMGMVERFQGEPGLGLWHEVTVFPEGRLVGEYLNCTTDGTLMAMLGSQIYSDQIGEQYDV
ncbi:MAG: phenylacetaldoxime dehydratase family protein [Pseudomonadota bacterium]